MPIYNLIEYSSNYSETTGSLWFYSKEETNFNGDLANTNNSKSLMYKAKLLENTSRWNIWNSKNATTAVPLKKTTKKTPTLWPLFMNGVQLPQG